MFLLIASKMPSFKVTIVRILSFLIFLSIQILGNRLYLCRNEYWSPNGCMFVTWVTLVQGVAIKILYYLAVLVGYLEFLLGHLITFTIRQGTSSFLFVCGVAHVTLMYIHYVFQGKFSFTKHYILVFSEGKLSGEKGIPSCAKLSFCQKI